MHKKKGYMDVMQSKTSFISKANFAIAEAVSELSRAFNQKIELESYMLT